MWNAPASFPVTASISIARDHPLRCSGGLGQCPPPLSPGREIVDTLIDLPLVLPPTVAGLALLLAFGRMGLIGGFFYDYGISIAFTTLAM